MMKKSSCSIMALATLVGSALILANPVLADQQNDQDDLSVYEYGAWGVMPPPSTGPEQAETLPLPEVAKISFRAGETSKHSVKVASISPLSFTLSDPVMTMVSSPSYQTQVVLHAPMLTAGPPLNYTSEVLTIGPGSTSGSVSSGSFSSSSVSYSVQDEVILPPPIPVSGSTEPTMGSPSVE